ncbi:MAG: antitoxin [Planctomycetota bacterium]
MKRTKVVQYTIRGVPAFVDRAIRARAKKENKSLNQLALEALQQALGLDKPRVYTDLDEFVGTWVEDPEFDKAIAEQDQIDEELWR